MTDEEIVKESTESLLEFFKSIEGDPDIYKEILLEEVFKMLLDKNYFN
jgi:hypothetical protein